MNEGTPASQRDRTLRELCQSIELLVWLLESVGETHWTDWLQTDLRRLRSGDTYALQHVLQAFGGMGSFNDLVIHPLNGHDVDKSDTARISDRVSDLRSDIYRLTNELERIVGDR